MDRRAEGPTTCLVIPCFNEQERLSSAELAEVFDDVRLSILFVDDGSTDSTLASLRAIEVARPRVRVLALAANVGKGEAVRLGMQAARGSSPAWIGYVDADLATSASEMCRLMELAERSDDLDVIMGARVALLGRSISRSPWRHYTGRLFATLASATLRKPVYDTQCGAKLFRSTAALATALERPFRSRWAFDVELLGRLDNAGVGPRAFWEEPLLAWHDVGGSRRTVRSSIRSTADLGPIWLELRRARDAGPRR